jgi:hypothetical protein
MLLLAVIMAILLLRSMFRLIAAQTRWPFVAKGQLLNGSEQLLYRRLCMALPGHRIFSQVSLSQIIQVSDKVDFGKWFNRISRKSVDFVVCSPGFAILAIIERDGSTHSRADRQHADAVKDKALQSAGLPVIRWPVNAMPTEADIREEIGRLHGSSPTVPGVRRQPRDFTAVKA